MKGSEPPRIKVKPQNNKTMYKENKCFFSVSLENGIIITGDNPDMINSFLTTLEVCINDAISNEINNKHEGWIKELEKLKQQITKAWLTIYNNTKKRTKQ